VKLCIYIEKIRKPNLVSSFPLSLVSTDLMMTKPTHFRSLHPTGFRSGFLTFFEPKDLSHSFCSWTKRPNAYMDYTLNSWQYWASNLFKSIFSLFWFLWNSGMTNQAFLWPALPQRQSVHLQSNMSATQCSHRQAQRLLFSFFLPQKQRRMRLLKWRMCVRVSQSPQWVSSRLPADRRSHRQPTNPFACCRVLKNLPTMVGMAPWWVLKNLPTRPIHWLVIVKTSFPILFVAASPRIPLKKHIVSQMPNHGLCSTMNTIFLPYLNRF